MINDVTSEPNSVSNYWTYACYKSAGCCETSCEKKNGEYVNCDAAKLKSCSDSILGLPAYATFLTPPGKSEGAVCNCEGVKVTNLSEISANESFKKLMTLNGEFDFTQVVNVLSGLSNVKYDTDKKFPTPLSKPPVPPKITVPPPTSGVKNPLYDDDLILRTEDICDIYGSTEQSIRAWRNFLKCARDCERGIRSACITHLNGGGTNMPPCPKYEPDGRPIPFACYKLAPLEENAPERVTPPTKPTFPCGCPDSRYCGSEECVNDNCKKITGSEDCDGDPGLRLAAQFSCFDCAECAYLENKLCYECYLGKRQNCTEGNEWGAPKCLAPRPLPRGLWPTEETLNDCFGSDYGAL